MSAKKSFLISLLIVLVTSICTPAEAKTEDRSPASIVEYQIPDNDAYEARTNVGELYFINKSEQKYIVTSTGTGCICDVMFLTDTTGSMYGYVSGIQSAFSGILEAIDVCLPGTDIMYCVADYRDYTDGGNYQTYGVNLIQPFTSNPNLVQAAINSLSAGGGADGPESQLKSMVNIASNWLTPSGDLGFNGRANASKVLIWAGDWPGHISGDEPGSSGFPPYGYYPTLDATIDALTAQGIMVFALNTTACNNGLDMPYGGLYGQTPQHQQADEITSATDGILFCNVGSGGPSIEDAIIEAITTGVCHLTLTKVDDINDCVGPGDEITYTICYSYSGDANCCTDDINDVNIVDYLPAEVDFNSASGPNCVQPDSNTVIWHIGTLHPGDSGSVTLKVKVKCSQPGTTITNHCEIRSSGQIVSTAYEHTPVCSPTLTKVDNITGCVGPEDNITYSICYDANGYDSTNVVITDFLPPEVNFISATGNYQHISGTVTWNIGTLGPNDSCCVTLTVQVKCPEPNSIITNHCEMTGDCIGPISADENTPVCSWYPTLTKVDNITGCVGPGDDVNYSICYAAHGYGVTNVVITDVLPDGLDFNSASGDWSRDSNTVTWHIDTLGPNDSCCVTLTVKVKYAQPNSKIINCCEMTGDCMTSGVTACEDTNVCPGPTLTEVADWDCVGPGDDVNYSICYAAHGYGVTNVVITDSLPPGTEFVSATGDYGHSSGTVTWNIGTIGPDDSGCVTLTVQLVDCNEAGRIITNCCEMTGDCMTGVNACENTNTICSQKPYCAYVPGGLCSPPGRCRCEMLQGQHPQDNWVGGFGSDGKWSTAANWAAVIGSVRPPGCDTFAAIEPKGPDPCITGAMGNIGCAKLSVQPWSWSGAPSITLTIEADAGLVDCGVVIGISSVTDYDSATLGHGTINMYGGTVFTSAEMHESPYLAPGIPEQTPGLWVGGGESKVGPCYGILNMHGGLMVVPRIAVYYGDVNLTGGILKGTSTDPNDFIVSDFRAMNRINVAGGELRLQGDRTAHVSDFAALNKIVAYQNRGSSSLVIVYYPEPNYTSVTAIGDLGAAWNPNPEDGAVEVNFTPVLTWSPGNYVQSTNEHQVYFGTSFNNVNDATPANPLGVYMGTRDVNNYTPAGPLAFNKVYYWRIDEVNDANAGSPWKGVTWNFTTVSGKARNPYPRDNSNDAYDVNKLYMRWTSGPLTQSTNGHRVYFGTDYNEVRDATTATTPIYRGARTDANYPLSYLSPDYTLVPDANYYWRVDEVNEANGLSPWVGDVWHHVFPNYYIIDNFNNYTSSTDMNLVWKQNKVTSLCPGGGHQDPGGVLILDMFAKAMILDYNNTGKIKDRFSEARWEGPATGTDWTIPGVPSGPVKLLHIAYNGLSDNNADPCLDRMYVAIGDTCSVTLKRIGPVIYNPDPLAQRKTSWTDWYVKISDVSHDPNPGGTPTDVNLHKIRYVFIGFGLRCNIYGSSGIPGGGTGRVMFDDIWLTQPICNPPFGPAADFTGDCFVDMRDVDIFVNDWLLADTTLSYPDAVAPPVGPVLWYDFNETDGNIAHNTGSGGSTYDASIINNGFVDVHNQLSKVWDINGPNGLGGCINLMYGKNSYVNVPADVLAPFADAEGPAGMTFTFWINTNDINYPVPSELPAIVSASTTGISPGTEVIEIECPTSDIPPKMHAAIGAELYVSDMKHSDFGGRWNHYAVVKDADTNTMSIYENGAQIASITREDIVRPLLSATPLIFKIGERYGWDPSMVGRIDDFRLYDYALDANEVAWIATNGTRSLFVPLADGKGTTNLKTGSSPERVDFGDFALFADQWLTEQLWP